MPRVMALVVKSKLGEIVDRVRAPHVSSPPARHRRVATARGAALGGVGKRTHHRHALGLAVGEADVAVDAAEAVGAVLQAREREVAGGGAELEAACA